MEEDRGGPIFTCPSCPFSTYSIKSNVSHQRLHIAEFNFNFKCPWPTCHWTFSTYKAAVSHISRFHQQAARATQQTKEAPSFLCSVLHCSLTFNSASDLCHHIFQHFQDSTENVKIPCPLLCPSADHAQSTGFTRMSSFRTHLSLKHKGWKDNTPSVVGKVAANEPLRAPSHLGSDFDMNIDIGVQEEEGNENDDDDDGADAFSFDSVVDSIGKFYLMLEGDCLLPASTVQKVSQYITFLSNLVQIKTEKALKKELNQIDLPDAKRDQIIQRVLAADPLYACHHVHSRGPSFTTEDRRKKYFRDRFNFVDVEEMSVSIDKVDEKYVHYVPVEATLNLTLKDPTVKVQVLKSFSTSVENPDIISDYNHGSGNSETNPKVINVALFIDGFNMANPLGAAKNLYKTVGVYMSILNMKPFNRAKLDGMYLVMLVQEKVLEYCKHTKCLKKGISCSHNECFQRLINDLNGLHDRGISFEGEQVKVCLKFLIGDNLGAHIIAGLVRSFSRVMYFCRFCEIKREDFLKNPHSALGPERTIDSYNATLSSLKVKRSLSNRDISSLKGIRFDSAFNRVKGFHVSNFSLPSCLGHDLFEGVASWDVATIIHNFIDKSWFTLQFFEARLKDFQCSGSDCGNKPKSISKKKSKLGLHAVQTWFIVRFLPFLIGDKVKDKNDPDWQLYLKLKIICEFICAPRLSHSQVESMRAHILVYMEKRKSFGLKFKPKHHYLLHYADLYLKRGPLINLWAMRFESLHGVFKKIAINCRNFSNITKTMSSKYQLYLAYKSTGPLFPESVQPSKPTAFSMQGHDVETQDLLQFRLSSGALQTNEIEYHGLSYKKGAYILLGFISDSHAVSIGLIVSIILDGTDVHLVLETMTAILDQNLGLYKISCRTSERKLLNCTALETVCLQSVYPYKQAMYFTLKYQPQKMQM